MKSNQPRAVTIICFSFQFFDVYCDDKFFERTKNAFMNVEVWQRGNMAADAADAMIGVAKLPLHQFYIAFYDINVRLHVSKQKVNASRTHYCFHYSNK